MRLPTVQDSHTTSKANIKLYWAADFLQITDVGKNYNDADYELSNAYILEDRM